MRRRERGRPGTREERGRRGKGAKSKGEEGANSPFYSKPGIPRCCQVTVGCRGGGGVGVGIQTEYQLFFFF